MKRSIVGYMNHLAYKLLPAKAYLKLFYFIKMHKWADLNNPKTFNEKMLWLTIYYKRNCRELLIKCFDKYRVRQYVKEVVGEQYLTGLCGVYTNADEISICELPDKFVAKISQGCGKNIIVFNKKKVDEISFKKQLNQWLAEAKTMRRYAEMEDYFYDGNPVIIVETLLEDNGQVPDDYKIYCFNGKVKMIRVAVNPVDDIGNRKKEFIYNTYDSDWNFLDFNIGNDHISDSTITVEKPKNFTEMCNVAETLSKDFPFVRVDLYNIDGAVYFGELTWFPGSTFNQIKPDCWDSVLGDKLALPRD